MGAIPLNMHPLRTFDGREAHPGELIRLAKNVYGTLNGPRTYEDGLKLQKSFIYTQRKADICVYYKRVGANSLNITVAIDVFS